MKQTIVRRSVLSCFALLGALPVLAGNWPAWRGPDATGVSPEKDLPLTWSEKDNVRWRVALPDKGNSSPIVWGDRVFITQAIPQENRRTVICFDRKTGQQLWQSAVTYTDKEPSQPNNPYCSASPVTDGERVVASFGSAGLYCYDFQGKELWHRDLGRMSHMFGNASSPILYGDLCIFYFGPDEKDYVIAVDKKTGNTVWRVDAPKPSEDEKKASSFGGPPGGFRGGPPRGDRPPGLTGNQTQAPASATDSPGRPPRDLAQGAPPPPDSGPGNSPPGGPPQGGFPPRGGRGGGGPGGMMGPPPPGTWTTPVVMSASGRDELIISFAYRLVALDPKTGKEFWSSKGLTPFAYASPIYSDDLLVAFGGQIGSSVALAVKPGGSGDVTESRRVWQVPRAKSRFGTGVVWDGHLYLIADSGVAECWELATGKVLWQERLAGPGAEGGSWSSMVLADGKLYVPNKSGDVFVLKASPKFELLATNSVNEPMNASLAVSNGEIFIRTDKGLWCIGKKPS